MPLDPNDGPNAWVDHRYREAGLPQNAFGANSSNSTAVGEGGSAAPAEQTGQQMSGPWNGVPATRNGGSRAGSGRARARLAWQ